MAHTLTFSGFGSMGNYVTVNGESVSSPYTIKNGDVIVARYGSLTGRTEIIVNTLEYIGTGNQIDLSDVDIVIWATTNPNGPNLTEVTINYSESGGGGTMLDVTYNSQKIIDSLEVNPPVAVAYNGATIATLNNGDTKTLSCNGKVMSSDVVLEYGGGSSGETWIINETPVVVTGMPPLAISFTVNFNSNGTQFGSINGYSMGNKVLSYDNTAVWSYNAISEVDTWTDQAYRTIILDEPASGDFLTWLQSNAVKQTSNGESTKTIKCNGKVMASDVILEVKGVTPITDLTGCSWVGNDEILYTGDIKWYVDFHTIDCGTGEDRNGTYIELYREQAVPPERPSPSDGDSSLIFDSVIFNFLAGTYARAVKFNNSMNKNVVSPSDGVIHFTGGTDATNQELIAWLQANGTLYPPLQ